ncbi:hypothetical protein [Cohnella nanjingensis]|uniref:Uncharacterized protein n=1 Tax=Cohnella nanjingensis TaxID=1387779 RepID=A0A7X0RS85_9BACL|nr:hypothetical protein [Cohnella nanjingensis]MBB6672591.1 hypothetical protein [Cohnella nanjingensis]
MSSHFDRFAQGLPDPQDRPINNQYRRYRTIEEMELLKRMDLWEEEEDDE